jgi:hypothetical protein
MMRCSRILRLAILACVSAGLTAPVARADGPPPNWSGGGSGTTHPEGGVDVDAFGGRSTVLGPFTGVGFHVLDAADFTFAGEATWTTPDGATLAVTYAGQVFPSGDPDFPYGFAAVLAADGGTGRLAGAKGTAAMTGAFTGVPGELYFEVEGTLHPRGK